MSSEYTPPPKLERLTPETLASIDDDVIESSLIDYVSFQRLDTEDELEAISALPEAVRAWYIAFIVDLEVLNGGFNQFFFNTSGQLAFAAPDAFNTIGIPAAGELVTTALRLLESHAPALQEAHDQGTIEAFMETYINQPFAELDRRYSEGEDEWRRARIRFIRQDAGAFRHP